MGGKAFSAYGLTMPRMPPGIYEKVLAQVHTQLRTVYSQIATPIEGPAKPDHGDIDVLVLNSSTSTNPTNSQLATILGATHTTQVPKSKTTHFAIPWPTTDTEDPAVSTSHTHAHIQVDVHVCATPSEFRYTLFQNAHSDLWVMLGAMLRPYGFVSIHTGFVVILPSLEAWNKPLARVQLTDDPDVVLRYLGLDPARYWNRFGSWEELMAYIGGCRFHDPMRGAQYDDVEGQKAKLDMKAHDRSKAKKRAMFAYWLEEYLPMHRGDKAGSASGLSREEVLADVKNFFGGEVAREIDERLRVGGRTMGVEKLWSDIRQGIRCEGSDLTYTMKGLRREIAGEEVDVDGLEEVRIAFVEGKWDVVKEWAEKNWEEVKERQVLRDREKSAIALKQHFEKTKVAEPEEAGNGDGLEELEQKD